MTENEVPLDLQRQIEELESGEAGGGYTDLVKFVDSIPDTLPEKCPGCGASLTPTRVYVDGNEDPVAARAACKRTHDDGTVATYIYEVDAEALYLEKEVQPESFTGDFETDER